MAGWRAALTGIALIGAAGVAQADDFKMGSSLIALQVTHSIANLVYAQSPGYITASDHSELGVQAQIWRFYSSDYAVVVSGGVGFFNETDKPGAAAPVGSQDFKYTQSSWQVRLGGDRVVHLGDKLQLFVGPGVQYWSGKAKFEGGAAPVAAAVETPTVNRWAIEGRVGFLMPLNKNTTMFAQMGHYIGYATAKDKGAEATWWPSGHDGALGLAFRR